MLFTPNGVSEMGAKNIAKMILDEVNLLRTGISSRDSASASDAWQ